MELDKAIKSRKSTKKFTSKKPDWRDIIECIDAARHTPRAGGNYVAKFILVDDSKKIEKIAEICEQKFIAQSKYIVIVCSNPSRLINAYEEKGEIYTRQQAGAAIQNFLLKIEEKGLAACWVGHFTENKLKTLLKIPEELLLEAVIPVGFSAEKNKQKKEPIDMERILSFNSYENKRMGFKKKTDV